MVSYNSIFLGFDPNSALGGVGGTKIQDLPGIGTICSVFNFCICIDVKLFSISVRPFQAIYNLLGCDKTIAQFILDALAAFITTSEPGAIVVADTDGDGFFDYKIAEGGFPLSGSATVPNNVNGQGQITVRMVSGWPNAPADVCGNVTPEGKDLLEILPIGSIPIVGPPIEDLLETANCGSNLSFTGEETVVYPVMSIIVNPSSSTVQQGTLLPKTLLVVLRLIGRFLLLWTGVMARF